MKEQQKQNEIIKLIIFLFVLFIIGIVILNNCIRYTNYYTAIQIDERVYKNTTDNWRNNGTAGLIYSYQNIGENKPISFLFIQRLLNADSTYTRYLNAIIIFIISILIFKMSATPYLSYFH